MSDFRKTDPKNLEELLRRGDVWRGHSQYFSPQQSLSSGFDLLDSALLCKGWPRGTLVELLQPTAFGYGEWQLLLPALRLLPAGYIVLLDPPALPFAQKLIQEQLDLDRLLVVQTETKADFVSSFIDLARSPACAALLAWQPKQVLSYTELRKCLLATAGTAALDVLFRHSRALEQSSPATLRVLCQWQQQCLRLQICKQKGVLLKRQPEVLLPLEAVEPRVYRELQVQLQEPSHSGAQVSSSGQHHIISPEGGNVVFIKDR